MMTAVAVLCSLAPVTASVKNPIVVVPGLGGSVLEARLHHVPKYRDCETKSDWYTIWASVVQGVTRYDCFIKDFSLYVQDDGTLSNYTGVEIRPRDYGGTGGIEYSNAGTHEPKLAYMHKLVAALEGVGYKAGETLRAATNDFRAAGVPEQLEIQYQLLKNLIEDTSKMNNGAAVHLLSHSLGGPYTTLFLTTYVDASWKSTYVASHIMLSSPLLGTPVAIEGVLSGPMYDFVPQFLPKLVVPAIRTFPSITWMFPRVAADGTDVWGKQNFIETPNYNYTQSNLRELIQNVKATVLDSQWEKMIKRTHLATADPGVPVFCMFANDTKTDLSIKVESDKFDKKGTRLEYTWGDGTVSIESLRYCNTWSQVTTREISFGGSLSAHTEIVQNDEVIKNIIKWVG